MKLDELRENHEIKTWFRDTNAAPATQHNFIHAMTQYTDFLKMSPEQLLDEAEAEMGLSGRKRRLKDHILDFREHLQQKGVADSTVKNRIASIRSFYVSNDIMFPKIRGEKSKSVEGNDKVPTKEDLQECLSVCDPLEKAVMLTGISSGMAANEIRNLKVKQFKDGYDHETGITTIRMRRQKTEVDFVTFLSPEASKAVLEYLEYRDRPLRAVGSRRKAQVEKQRTTPDSYLFIPKGVSSEYIKKHDEESRKITDDGMMKLYRNISEKARKNTTKGYNFIRSHTMRKYFNSALLNAGCDSFSVEYWMGHALDETKKAYFRANIQQQKELYKKYVPYLTIEKGLDVAASQEYREIAKENDILRAETARHIVERQEISEMEKRLKRMAEKQLQSDIKSIESMFRIGAIDQEEFNLQLEILKIGYRMDIGEIQEAEGNKQIEKLLES